MGPYMINSFSTSRNLEDGEQLDFSSPSPGMSGPGVTLSIDQACYVFQQGWLANLTKGYTNLRDVAACFRSWPN